MSTVPYVRALAPRNFAPPTAAAAFCRPALAPSGLRPALHSAPSPSQLLAFPTFPALQPVPTPLSCPRCTCGALTCALLLTPPGCLPKPLSRRSAAAPRLGPHEHCGSGATLLPSPRPVHQEASPASSCRPVVCPPASHSMSAPRVTGMKCMRRSAYSRPRTCSEDTPHCTGAWAGGIVSKGHSPRVEECPETGYCARSKTANVAND